MSENVIYCYSGSGNCLDMAKNIAKELGNTEIVMMRSFPVKTDATEAKRVGFIFPCYGGGLPGNVESYVKSIHIGIDAYKFAIVQYAGYKGCGLHKIDKIVDLDYAACFVALGDESDKARDDEKQRPPAVKKYVYVRDAERVERKDDTNRYEGYAPKDPACLFHIVSP